MGASSQGDIYLSLDIEADGPYPGRYSMLACGLCVAGRFDGRAFVPADPTAETFYTELAPISDTWDPAALEVSSLDREGLARNGLEAGVAMEAVVAWIEEVSEGEHPVLVGFPLVYDWLFFYWYLARFVGDRSPISFSSGLDMKTMYQQKAQVPLALAGKDDLPASLQSRRRHTHNALDDAIEQAEIFAKLFAWDGRG